MSCWQHFPPQQQKKVLPRNNTSAPHANGPRSVGQRVAAGQCSGTANHSRQPHAHKQESIHCLPWLPPQTIIRRRQQPCNTRTRCTTINCTTRPLLLCNPASSQQADGIQCVSLFTCHTLDRWMQHYPALLSPRLLPPPAPTYDTWQFALVVTWQKLMAGKRL